MPDLSHVMPNPVIVPILWGHDYVVNQSTTKHIKQMGLAQYGIQRPTLSPAIVIDDINPPRFWCTRTVTITWSTRSRSN